MPPTVLKTFLFIGDDPTPGLMHTIKREGKMWLVPSWLESHATGERTPERLILLDVLPHQKAEGVFLGKRYHFVLTHPLPRDLLTGRIPPVSEDTYVVVESPDIGPRPGEPRH